MICQYNPTVSSRIVVLLVVNELMFNRTKIKYADFSIMNQAIFLDCYIFLKYIFIIHLTTFKNFLERAGN